MQIQHFNFMHIYEYMCRYGKIKVIKQERTMGGEEKSYRERNTKDNKMYIIAEWELM